MVNQPVYIPTNHFSGRRWKRELRGGVAAVTGAFVLGFGLVFLLDSPERPLR